MSNGSQDLDLAVQQYASQWSLDKTEAYVVGVSGGRDSIALVHALLRGGFSNLSICHLNHGLRDDESDGDETFVRELSASLGLNFYSKRVDLSSSELGLESAAREARYLFFAEVVQASKSVGVFLGHHADDQAETILFNLFRGSAGLKSIPAMGERELNGIEFCIYRPLLEVSRDSINQAIKADQLDYREDATNAEAVTARNRIRHELLPLAKEILQRDVSPMLLRASEAVKRDNEFISSLWNYDEFLDPQGRLFVPNLLGCHRSLQIRVIKRYLEENQICQISTDLLDRAVALLTDQSLAKINVPGGYHLRRKEKRLFLEAEIKT